MGAGGPSSKKLVVAVAIAGALGLLVFVRMRGSQAKDARAPEKMVCGEVPLRRLVRVDKDHAWGNGIDVPFWPDGSCGEVVSKLDAIDNDEVVLAIDPTTPNERALCLFDALAHLRGAEGTGRHDRRCTVLLVGTAGDTASAPCTKVLLPHLRCLENPPMAGAEREQVLHVELGEDKNVLMWERGQVLISVVDVPKEQRLDAKVLNEWKIAGQHRDPLDRRVDGAVLHGLPGGTFGATLAQLVELQAVTRAIAVKDADGNSEVQRPAFDFALASHDYRAALVTRDGGTPYESVEAWSAAIRRRATRRRSRGRGGIPSSPRSRPSSRRSSAFAPSSCPRPPPRWTSTSSCRARVRSHSSAARPRAPASTTPSSKPRPPRDRRTHPKRERSTSSSRAIERRAIVGAALHKTKPTVTFCA